MPGNGRFDAVLFDYGGVLTASPFEALRALVAEVDLGLEPERLLHLVFGPYHEDTDHAWHRVERGEITFVDYYEILTADLAAEGVALDLSTFAGAVGNLAPNEHMLELVQELKAAGFRLAMVTNNVAEGRKQWAQVVPPGCFDAIVDSSAVGMRKPNPRIYQHALAELGGVPAERAVFLDDAEGNIVGARNAGLAAIHVTTDTHAAEAELRTLVGLHVGGRA